MSLLNKIVKSSIAENKINRRLHDISYSAINGERQEPQQQPEGVVMLGQINNKKPLSAITKEMIQEYQERENAPIMIDGEARVYNKPSFEPIMQIPTDTEDIKDEARTIFKNRLLTGRNISEAEIVLKDLHNAKLALETDINVFGTNRQKLQDLANYNDQIKEYKNIIAQLRNDYDVDTYEIERRIQLIKDTKKQNALIQQQNKEEVKRYEQELEQVNRNRLNLQQQPYESDMAYYRRLKEIEQSKYDPVLYKQWALNENVKDLKSKLPDLFKDQSYIEDVLKSLGDEDKYQVNKYFDEISKAFINKYGYNPSMSVKAAAKELPSILNDLNKKTSILQAAFKRKQVAQGNDDFATQKQAVSDLQAVLKRKKIAGRFPRVLQKYREIEQEKQENAAANLIQNAIRNRKAIKTFATNYVDKLNKEKKKNVAASTLQGAIKRKQVEEVQKAEREAEQRQAASTLQAVVRQKQLEQADKDFSTQKQAALDLQAVLKRKKIAGRFPRVLQRYREIEQEKQQNAANAIKAAVNRKNVQSLYNTDLTEYIRPAATAIQSAYRSKLARKELANIRNAVSEAEAQALNEMEPLDLSLPQQQRERREEAIARSRELRELRERAGLPPLPPEEIENVLSALSTSPQEEARRRRERSDKGKKRGPYSKQPAGRALELSPPRGRARSQSRAEERNPDEASPPRTRSQTRAERQALSKTRSQTKEFRKGQGIRKLIKQKPVSINKEEKMKNRLRLVASQIEAGNTNPKLIVEVNNLYKRLYNINNAYMFLNKNKK